MDWLRLLIVALALAEAGWMAFDGMRALLVGDYVTPRSGRYAGQLGPWARLVSAVGVEPRSTLMKAVFAGYGLAWLAIVVAFVLDLAWARAAMLTAATGALWFLPFGTLLSVVQIGLLAMSR